MKKRLLVLTLGMILLCGCGKQVDSNVSTEAVTSSTLVEETNQVNDEVTTEESALEEAVNSDTDVTSESEPEVQNNIPLKDLCADYFSLGVGINGSTIENQTLNIPEYMALSKQEFNSCTLTNLMKSCYILNQSQSIKNLSENDGIPALDFSTIDPSLQWCQDNGMKMRGHTLVWHTQAPLWFFKEGYEESGEFVDRDTMLFRMESYIAQMLEHVQTNFPGVIYCWDVVNEAVDPDLGDKDSYFRCRTELDGQVNPWYATIGEDYVEMAFTYARKYADPEVKLFYNDYNTFMYEKTNAIYALCDNLNQKGLIDGIGMQGYWGTSYPGTTQIEKAIRTFAKLGLEIQITELSISIDDESQEQLDKQAKAYGQVFIMLKMLDDANGGPANITNVTFFGLIDHYREGDTTNTRLFDKNYQPKPSYDRVYQILSSYNK